MAERHRLRNDTDEQLLTTIAGALLDCMGDDYHVALQGARTIDRCHRELLKRHRATGGEGCTCSDCFSGWPEALEA